jgi:hypothetical protein
MKAEFEHDIYSTASVDSYLDDDEISAQEEGFMMGYLGDMGVI